MKIKNNDNLQVLMVLNIKKTSVFPFRKIFDCRVFDGKNVKKGDEIFIIHLNKEVENFAFYIPWQPCLVKRVVSLENKKKNVLARIYYRKEGEEIEFGHFGEYV